MKETWLFFRIPLFVLITIVLYFFTAIFPDFENIRSIILSLGIAVGSFQLIKDTLDSLLRKDLALDYIAILAIVSGLLMREFLVSAVIVLMLSGGDSLERFAMNKAKNSLTKLANRIPSQVSLWDGFSIGEKINIADVKVDALIAIRRGEVIPLDGTLESPAAQIDESSLTGESFALDKFKGAVLRSGTVNQGDVIIIKVTKVDKESSYRKIIDMVQKAQEEKSPFIRLADQYSGVFTVVTLIIATVAFYISHDPLRVLAVLVIATPCPLILATPIALIGGVNSSARENIIIKRIQSLEILARVNALIFDKTGTLTLGKPKLAEIKVYDSFYSKDQILSIAAAIEKSSVHPLAKAIVQKSKEEKLVEPFVKNIQETIGFGISAQIDKKTYLLKKSENNTAGIVLYSNNTALAEFSFSEEVKEGTVDILQKLKNSGLSLFMFTGDKKERADELASQLQVEIQVQAECKPEDKKNGIEALKKNKKITAMIGDGINDAPALAFADVGLVFSNEEQTASSEAADVVFLSTNIDSIYKAISISKQTIKIAKQSIFFGIGLSIIGMLFAAGGFIVPVIGAFIQEVIDVAVIINALRASRIISK